MRYSALFLIFFVTALAADEIADARQRWSESPHGPLLERILPPTFEAAQLPEPDSRGARLTIAYCVQCHNLPNPAMHDATRWLSVVARMVPRMEGKGNLGKVMADMMVGVRSPSDEETRVIVAYLRKHGQKPIDAARYPELFQPAGESFRLACNQCHALPDPKRHNAVEWRAVVVRMQENMEWMNRVVGTKPVPGEPQLRVEDILAFLEKHARR